MAKHSLSVTRRRIDLGPILDELGEALCIVEVSINSLEAREHGRGPELSALQAAARGLNHVHQQLSEASL